MAVLQSVARRIAQQEGISPDVFVALVNQESQFNTHARSPAGALGLTQLMPGTAAGLGVKDPFDPEQNLRGGARYLKQQLKAFGGNYSKALAAYNAGPGAVQKYGGIPPYAETQHYVRTILGAAGSSVGAGISRVPGSPQGGTTTRTIPGRSLAPERGAAVSSFLGSGRNDSQNNLDFALQMRSLVDAPSRTVTSPGATTARASTAQTSAGGDFAARANAINAQHLPYKWGGGHQGQTGLRSAVPLDCSGAVSKVLGIDPRVASDFKTFGKAGYKPGGVNIYASGSHVLMEIGGHLFGTSASNPGGGAGWIKRGDVSPSYLRGFTVRHLG